MSKRYFAIIPEQCGILNTLVSEICLPIKLDCGIPPDGLIVNCGEEHNCSECCVGGKLKYFQPFKFGDTIYIQTQIFDDYNPDPTMPVDGWGTWLQYEMIDLETGMTINTNPIVIGELVGWNGLNSFQLLKLYMPVNDINPCWKLKIKIYDTENNLVKELCSQEFKLEDECSDTVLISSDREGFDCEGNFYDLPVNSYGSTPFKYLNDLRFYVDIQDLVPIRETITRNGLSKKVNVKFLKEYALYCVPMYVVKYITNRIENNKKLKINGKYYDVEFSEVQGIEETCMYNIKLNIVYGCKEEQC